MPKARRPRLSAPSGRRADMPRVAYLMLTDGWDPYDPTFTIDEKVDEFVYTADANKPSPELITLWAIHGPAICAERGDPDFVPAIIRGVPRTA